MGAAVCPGVFRWPRPAPAKQPRGLSPEEPPDGPARAGRSSRRGSVWCRPYLGFCGFSGLWDPLMKHKQAGGRAASSMRLAAAPMEFTAREPGWPPAEDQPRLSAPGAWTAGRIG